ncbi:CGNR zinc finger domain-containing protein [Thermocrispum municipale]|uniref:CGNR zinc finger domain-containing protein n=1 Tax=Thermocrispum municipale TaxID=37926 RepID=UPI00048DAB78|nr:CGNR zinc finger domain-containing protein [Thermocrispum municipale]
MNAGTRMVTGADGQRWLFDPGSLCLELLLTGGPAESGRPELLRTPADLVGWLTESRLARTAEVHRRQVDVRPSELRRIKELRDIAWRVMTTLARGGDPAPEQLEAINDYAQDSIHPELEPSTRTVRWAPMTGEQVLGTIARDAIDVIGGSVSRLRECAGEDCSLLFLDTSRPGNRRWCSMRRCGNREKVRAFRSRTRNDDPR